MNEEQVKKMIADDFDNLINERLDSAIIFKYISNLEKENKQLKEQLQNISNEFLKYDWKTSNKEQIINQLESLYNSIFRE